MKRLIDTASVIRSKNSGPYEITFDIIFKDEIEFEVFVSRNILTKSIFASLYGISRDDVLSIIAFKPSKALKITIKRPISSGALGERDVYGAQQHKPLLGIRY